MIETSWLTNHERGVLTAALRTYANTQVVKSRKQADARDRSMATANHFVASDLLRQLADR